ncbi:MAG: hypothetical protein DMG96_15995 [Acidobacteria bacterium]|nr:MAG: hypothetical protein DMG96_15995 [Acidobacteriota bacterium]
MRYNESERERIAVYIRDAETALNFKGTRAHGSMRARPRVVGYRKATGRADYGVKDVVAHSSLCRVERRAKAGNTLFAAFF